MVQRMGGTPAPGVLLLQAEGRRIAGSILPRRREALRRGLGRRALRPALRRSLGRRALGPALRRGLGRRTLGPALRRSLGRHALGPALRRSLGRHALRPALSRSLRRHALGPALCRGLGRRTLGPALGRGFCGRKVVIVHGVSLLSMGYRSWHSFWEKSEGSSREMPSMSRAWSYSTSA